MIRKLFLIAILTFVSACANKTLSEADIQSRIHQNGENRPDMRLVIDREGEIEIPRLESESKDLRMINDKLETIARSWNCDSSHSGEFSRSSFVVTERFLNDRYISLRYDAMQLCPEMPGPATRQGAVTLRLTDGKKMTVQELAPCKSPSEIQKMVLTAASRIAKAPHCPEPVYSGDFFFHEETIVFVEFFPHHVDTPCEIEVKIPLRDIACKK